MTNINISDFIRDYGKHYYFKINGVVYESGKGQRTFSTIRSLKASMNHSFKYTRLPSGFLNCKDLVNYIISQGQILEL